MQNQALLSHDCAGTSRRCIGSHLIHKLVVVPWIVMEDDEGLDARGIGEADALLPGRMPPILVRWEFRIGVGGVVDHHVGPIDQAKDIGIPLAGPMFGVGDVGHDLAAIFDPIAGRSVWVVQGFFYNETAATEIYPLSLRDALPITRLTPRR